MEMPSLPPPHPKSPTIVCPCKCPAEREEKRTRKKSPFPQKYAGKRETYRCQCSNCLRPPQFPYCGRKDILRLEAGPLHGIARVRESPREKNEDLPFFIAPLFSTYILGNPLAQGTNVNVRRREEKEKDEVGRRVVAGVGGKESFPPPPPPASFGANQTPPHRRRRGGGQRSSLSLIALSPPRTHPFPPKASQSLPSIFL